MDRNAPPITLTHFDARFGHFVERLAGGAQQELFLAAALASSSLAEGHTCLDLCQVADTPILIGESEAIIITPNFTQWRDVIARSPVVGVPGSWRPLILQENLLYLYRYWRYEHTLVEAITQHSRLVDEKINDARLREGIRRFLPSSRTTPDWRIVAAFLSVYKRLCLLSGGPGTGKTYLAARILALIMEQWPERPWRVVLCAPTGKATTRLQESVRAAKGELACADEIKSLIPSEAWTIHRLLKLRPHRPDIPFTPAKPLPYDIIVVDEASMIDLPLFSLLMAAIRPETRLILMGDMHQLASVEPGRVFGELCDWEDTGHYSAQVAKRCQNATMQEVPVTSTPHVLTDNIVTLTENYRFSPTSGIGNLSALVKNGNTSELISFLYENKAGEVNWYPLTDTSLPSILDQLIYHGYAPYLKEDEPERVFGLFQRFRILCALREGPYGVESINRLVEARLHRQGLIVRQSPWYRGKPVMVTKNDYALMLFNGDCGIILEERRPPNRLQAYFIADSGRLRSFLPSRLPPCETVYAMTVHKSQGSEFDEILIILPDRPSPLLTRELLYTAITRAREKVTIMATEEVLRFTVNRKMERTSGLGLSLRRSSYGGER